MLKYLSLIAIIILFIWISFFPAPIQDQYHIASKVFLLLAFLVLLIRKRSSIFKPNDFPLWFFLVAIGINGFFAQQRDIAFSTYLDLAIPMFLIYYLVSDSLSSQARFNLLAKIICISSILVALLAILETIFAFNPLYEYFIENPYYGRYITYFVRPMSTQFNPAPLGSYMLACLPFNLLLFKQSRNFLRLLGATGIVLNVVVIILTFSRGVFLGLIAMILFYLFSQRKYRSVAIFLVILIIAVFVCSYLPYPFSKFGIELTVGGGGITSTYRVNRCIMTQRILKDYPFVGLGFQHFRIRFYEFYPEKAIVPYEFMIADNMYLTLLAETGLLGFFGFLLFVFSFLKRGWKRLRVLNLASKERWQLLVVVAAFIGLLVSMVGYEFFYWPNQYILFCIIVGCIGAFCRWEEGYEY